MPCDIIFVALILALSSSARHSASSLAMYLSSGSTGLVLLLLMLFPVGFSLGILMCYNTHVDLGIFPLPWSATRQTWGCLLPQLSAVQTSPRRFTGHTFLCLCLSLSLASCDRGTYGERHHRFR
jgi:hypothetical protein